MHMPILEVPFLRDHLPFENYSALSTQEYSLYSKGWLSRKTTDWPKTFRPDGDPGHQHATNDHGRRHSYAGYRQEADLRRADLRPRPRGNDYGQAAGEHRGRTRPDHRGEQGRVSPI